MTSHSDRELENAKVARLKCQEMIEKLADERQQAINLGALMVAHLIDMAVLELHRFNPACPESKL